MALSLRIGAARERGEIRRRHDRDALAEIVDRERYRAAYALAQLEPGAWETSEWYTCQSPRGEALICHSSAGLGEATTIVGPPDAAAAILLLHPGGHRTFAIGGPEHVPALEQVHRLHPVRSMSRMLVAPDHFLPAAGETTPLLGAHVHVLNRLYSSEGPPTHYRREHVEQGWYRGVAVDGRLVAVAGTHAVSHLHGIAILGNVYTHPQHRGRGYARLATSAVSQALFEQAGVREVVLSVDPENTPAVRAYQRLGYREVGPIIEASAARRAGVASTALRRWWARRQGADGREVVAL